MFKKLTILIIFSISVIGRAQEPLPRPLSYEKWRAVQLTEAQNQVTRISNRITMVKATSGNINEISRLESSLRVAAQNIDFAGELTVEDYFNIYLSQFTDRDAVLLEAANSMSKIEVAMLLKSLLKSKMNTAYVEPASPVLSDLTGQKKL